MQFSGFRISPHILKKIVDFQHKVSILEKGVELTYGEKVFTLSKITRSIYNFVEKIKANLTREFYPNRVILRFR